MEASLWCFFRGPHCGWCGFSIRILQGFGPEKDSTDRSLNSLVAAVVCLAQFLICLVGQR